MDIFKTNLAYSDFLWAYNVFGYLECKRTPEECFGVFKVSPETVLETNLKPIRAY